MTSPFSVVVLRRQTSYLVSLYVAALPSKWNMRRSGEDEAVEYDPCRYGCDPISAKGSLSVCCMLSFVVDVCRRSQYVMASA